MKEITFRNLTADELELRPARCTEKGTQLLIYKDARCDQNILDETVGAFGWQRKHYELKGNMYCSLGIKNEETNEWVWKDDCGAESNTEKEKGEASDSFKRACVNWGIGRELYTAPFIWISENVKQNSKGFWEPAFRMSDLKITRFIVLQMPCVITDLIIELKGKRVYKYEDNNILKIPSEAQPKAETKVFEGKKTPLTPNVPAELLAPTAEDKKIEDDSILTEAKNHFLKFSKNKGVPYGQLDDGFLQWVINAEFVNIEDKTPAQMVLDSRKATDIRKLKPIEGDLPF